ncbi:nucleotide-binding oligomerization domain-containing protein 2-like isoform X3 [Pygocentrus nattereri]|uniref:nucleotide-binding oligomerization domain-containing protein 2-like isoform X3 n=1 Tax=Pygocentrus nattereri TaxID=42514 RepID=UPI0008144E3A|nr:nucleotide-binding oligomerization domain-containing protein 2-like isoform X3 [Pygocentrus nattereri]
MVSAQELLHSHREVLLDWLSVNPTPLLRWLADAGVLTAEQYRAVLERSPTNKVANVLEQVCANEQNSQGFLQVLQQVQGYYCTQLHEWIHQHCTETPPEPPSEPQPNPPGGKKKTKSLLSKWFPKGKSQEFTLPQKDEVNNTKNLKSVGMKVPLNAHKNTLLRQTERLMSYSEGEGQDSSSHAHIDIRYTELFVTEDDEGVTHGQHEYFTLASRRSPIYPHQTCRLIQPRDLLNPGSQTGCSPQRVKVKGIAGIGKSVAMQRLLYEWALGKHLQNFSCVFDLRFRELNLIDGPISLHELLASRFLYLQDILLDLFKHAKSLLFILDGLDEFRHRLDWNSKDRDLTVESKIPVPELLVALVGGNLLPECSVILTTRPSTDAPKRFFPRCCVVLGFQEKHVEEYTMKFYKDPLVAEKVFSYIVRNDNLFALSFIPLYCYIICSALAEFFSTDHNNEEESLDLNPPRTVSEVYYFYLYTTIKHHALKDKAETNSRPQILAVVKEQLMNLGRMAYENLLRNRILFDREDLEKFGLDPRGIRSTFLSQILVSVKEEKVEMFAFFHLTIQEYLAALFCVVSFSSYTEILTGLDYWCFGELRPPAENPPLTLNPLPAGDDLECPRVENLQMFTRFFSGLLRARLSRLLEGMVENSFGGDDGELPYQLGDWFQCQFKNRNLPNQMTLNLLHCLMELHLQETTGRAAPEISRLNLFKMKLSVVDCAAVHYVLQFSKHLLKELNLGYSNIGNKGFSRLGPILHRCESLYIRYNCLGTDAAILESTVLKSEDCQVKKLFMCGNKLGPEGARVLWEALEHNNSVEEVYLDITGITESGTENLVQCLSKNTALKSLTVVGNDLGEVGWERLRDLGRVRPDLRIISHFVDDLGLLEAYLGWVEEMRADHDQMESVKNADALQSVLKGLWLSEGTGENTVKAKELETKILQLLENSELSALSAK